MKESESKRRADEIAKAAAEAGDALDEEEAKGDDDDTSSVANVFDLMEQEEEKAAADEDDDQGGSNGVLSSINDDCGSELSRFQDAKKLDFLGKKVEGKRVFNNPLEWWKKNEMRFPILARLARIFLAVQPSSAPSERIFSVASRLLSARRTRMDPKLAGKALFVSENWEWFEQQVDLAKIELEAEDGADGDNSTRN